MLLKGLRFIVASRSPCSFWKTKHFFFKYYGQTLAQKKNCINEKLAEIPSFKVEYLQRTSRVTHLYFFNKNINKNILIKMWYILWFYFSTIKKIFLKCKLPLYRLNQIKGKQFYTLLPPLNMNRIIFFNLVYKIK